MWLNSPNNPTSVIMTKDYFKRVVEFAQGNQVIETGMNTMAQGAKLFLQGENLYLNKY